VHVDSPLVRYLPDYPNREFAGQATVRMLLSHTSGLGSYWNALYEERRATLTTVASHLPLFAADPIPFAPGARFRYSNAGYQVLGLIIERVSGQSYYDTCGSTSSPRPA
jgi:CubicO group peptidase (beta-lactamase class C family)